MYSSSCHGRDLGRRFLRIRKGTRRLHTFLACMTSFRIRILPQTGRQLLLSCKHRRAQDACFLWSWMTHWKISSSRMPSIGLLFHPQTWSPRRQRGPTLAASKCRVLVTTTGNSRILSIPSNWRCQLSDLTQTPSFTCFRWAPLAIRRESQTCHVSSQSCQTPRGRSLTWTTISEWDEAGKSSALKPSKTTPWLTGGWLR